LTATTASEDPNKSQKSNGEIMGKENCAGNCNAVENLAVEENATETPNICVVKAQREPPGKGGGSRLMTKKKNNGELDDPRRGELSLDRSWFQNRSGEKE